MQHVFSVWPVAQPVVGEMEMHSVANLATLQTPLASFFHKKSAQTLFSLWESPVQPREVLLSQHAHTPLSLSVSAQFLFRVFTHTSLSLRICSVSIQRAHTHLSLSLHLLNFCSMRTHISLSLSLVCLLSFYSARAHTSQFFVSLKLS